MEDGNYTKHYIYWDTGFDTADRAELDKLIARVIAPSPGDWKGVYTEGIGAPWDKLFRAAFLRENSLLFDREHTMNDDMLFNYQAFGKAGRIAGCMVSGYHFRQVASSNTHQYKADKENMFYLSQEQFYQYAAEHPENTDLMDAVRTVGIVNMISTVITGVLSPGYPGTLRDAECSIRAMTKRPLYQDALRYCTNRRLTIKLLVGKYLLRLPTAWPFIAVYRLNQLRKRAAGRKVS